MNLLKNRLNKNQINTLEEIGIFLDADKHYSKEELIGIHEKLIEHYIINGFNSDDSPNKVAYDCEPIIDLFYDEYGI